MAQKQKKPLAPERSMGHHWLGRWFCSFFLLDRLFSKQEEVKMPSVCLPGKELRTLVKGTLENLLLPSGNFQQPAWGLTQGGAQPLGHAVTPTSPGVPPRSAPPRTSCHLEDRQNSSSFKQPSRTMRREITRNSTQSANADAHTHTVYLIISSRLKRLPLSSTENEMCLVFMSEA